VSHTEKVVIIGAGDHGRGALEIFREASRHGCKCDVVGFLDDSQQKQGGTVGGLPVLGGLDWIHDQHRLEIGYVIGIADPRAKQRIAQRLNERSLTFVSIIHPAAFIATGVRVASGAVINAGAVIAYDTVIEDHAMVNLNATIGHDCVLGRFSTVGPGANIAGRVRLGEGCDVGMNATLGKGLNVGEWSVIGPGTVVIRNVASGQHVFGNPARVVPTIARISHPVSQSWS
jgi:sugar O-acyltransferase (sialic acid O-acetyltransferase NeuD family)